MPLTDLVACTAIIDGGPALSKAELVGQLLTLLAQAGHVPHADVRALQNAILRREQLGSTGIGKGLAIPHAKHTGVQHPLGILAVCRPSVEFDSLDGEPADIVALILSPPDQPGQHLGEASHGSEVPSRRLRDEEFCRRLRQAGSTEELREIIETEDGGMTRREWTGCKDPVAMLRLLRDRGVLTERKARLFGAAICRRSGNLLPGEGRTAVEAAERFADGQIGREDLDAARRGFTPTLGESSGSGSFTGVAVSYLMGEAHYDPAGYALDLLPWVAQPGVDQAAELASQAGILRCLFGPPPFRVVEVKAEWLAFGDGVVVKLARNIYDERAFDHRMPVLADALLDAGCDDEDLLSHLRGTGPHWPGCFVLDALLGRS